MKKKVYAFVLLALVYFFPFRWAFIEHPEPVKVFDTYVDGGGVPSAINMLLVIVGMLVFIGLMFADDFKEKETHSA